MAHVTATRRTFYRGPNDLSGPLILVAALALTVVAYAPGVGGAFHFDDKPNLGGLSWVTDWASALRFVTEGVAGPLGRPVALATFAAQAYAWPSAPDDFLYVNICIHLLNGVLVVWALHLLGVTRGVVPTQAARVAAISGALWMLLPILASSSLLIVQRMTTLSGTFSLLGLIGYLVSRRLSPHRPLAGLSLMTLAVAAGTGLSTLVKENGALLPLFVLVVELTLLRSPLPARLRLVWNAWVVTVLAVPAVLLGVYLAMQVDYPESVVLMRGFTASERLLTQAHVLWQYLYHAFLPATSSLGPFHDDYSAYGRWTSLSSFLAVGGWLAVLGCAAAFRRRAALFCFAVAWYLVGHSLESTTIPLELYFEHRNYLPLVGPVFALVSYACAAPVARPLVHLGLLSYGLILAAVLYSTTSLWGRPALAAEIWYQQHPHSTRAVQYVAQQLYRVGDLQGVQRVLSRYAEQHPESSGTALQALLYSCMLQPTVSHTERLRSIEANLHAARFEFVVFETLRQLYDAASQGDCDSVDRETIYELTARIASLPTFQSVPVMQHNLHLLMSEEGFARRDLDMTMRHIEMALESHYTMTTLIRAVQMLVSAGLRATAEGFIKDAYQHEPSNPLRAARWQRQLAALERGIERAGND